MRMIAMMAMALPLAACQGSATGPATTPPPAAQGGTCKNEGMERFVGQTASEAVGAELLSASGARTLRWGAPGMAMTMDYRQDRLTVSYDEKMVITAARCG